MQPLRIALTKGRLEKSTVQLFEQAGMDCSQLREKGRKLILPVGDGSLQAVLAKAADVITYVEHGVCDMGVVGKDTIMENGSHFFEILDLGFGRCGFALAAPKGSDFYGGYRAKTIATKYPNVARRLFREQTDGRAHHQNRGQRGAGALRAFPTALWTLWKPAPPCGKTAGSGGAHPPGVGPAHCKRRQPKAAQAGD